MAEVLSEVGYATAFHGKSHMGDVESSYLNKQDFDEALWTPYNQVPSLYVPRGQRSPAVMPTSMFLEMIPMTWTKVGDLAATSGPLKAKKADRFVSGVPLHPMKKVTYSKALQLLSTLISSILLLLQ